jgi:ATP-binding cassette subfamily B protein
MDAQVNIERVTSLLEQPITVADSPKIEDMYGGVFDPKPENWPLIKGEIEFRDVWFRYPDAAPDDFVLEDVNLKVRPGTTVAIVGETGAGKTTMVNLACRFFEPTRGQVLIDGVDYKERSQIWLRSNIGYVNQTPHLFSGTLADNIRYGKLDATEEEIKLAAKLVSCDIVADKLENGYQTDVGEGGDRLSTGEKQLVSFARAIVSDPPVFILDEATSSIDTEMEQLIQNAISHILKGRTSFIIAHRLSTIRSADLIILIEGNSIKEQGSHDELMEKRGQYYQLYTAMMIADESDLQGFSI